MIEKAVENWAKMVYSASDEEEVKNLLAYLLITRRSQIDSLVNWAYDAGAYSLYNSANKKKGEENEMDQG